jgi:hypothetical protein
MKLKLTTVEAERTRGAFCNPVTKWRYRITTGARCKGLLSQHMYTCPIKACVAGERMIKKLQDT